VLLRTEIAIGIQAVDLLFPIWELSVQEGPVKLWVRSIFQIVVDLVILALIYFQYKKRHPIVIFERNNIAVQFDVYFITSFIQKEQLRLLKINTYFIFFEKKIFE
jgi:hypothetical protein